MNYSDELNREKETEYIKLLSEKLKTNFVTPENREKFREASWPVYQYFIDKEYFSWNDINEVRTYLSEWTYMGWIAKTEKLLSRILVGFIAFCLFGIVLLVMTLVVLRYGFNTTIVGANEFIVILFIYTSAIGAAVIIGKKEHIAITYFIDKLPTSVRSIVDITN